MIITYLLAVVVLVILFTTRQNEKLKEVNEKYKKLREHLKETKNEKFEILTRHIPITGKLWMSQTVGTNTNKGGEIAVCLDGEPNEIFHVLIHELAHCTVKEYSHSPASGIITRNSETSASTWASTSGLWRRPNSVVNTSRTAKIISV